MITDPDLAHKIHYLFEWGAMLIGLAIYRAERRKQGLPGLLGPGSFAPLLGALIGAAVGNKMVFWFDTPQLLSGQSFGWSILLGGQSVVGGLLGGWIGVEVGKRGAGITVRTGDDYVLPILIGLAIGRVGCFLAGLHDGTYGLPTSLPWGVDFGDGVSRHPTQLYESLAALLAAVAWPWWRTLFASTPGLTFRVMMIGYLLWRLLVDLLKPVSHAYILGLSGIQWVCIVGLILIIMGLFRDVRKAENE